MGRRVPTCGVPENGREQVEEPAVTENMEHDDEEEEERLQG